MSHLHMDAIEVVKENLRLDRKGHKQSALRSLSTQESKERNIDAQKEHFERQIAAYQGEDPLRLWMSYIDWWKNTHLTSNRGLLDLLHKCTEKFLNDRRYANDRRYLKIWIQYIDMCPSPGDIFAFLYKNKIGVQHPLFWGAWARVLENQQQFAEVERRLEEGIRMCASHPKVKVLERQRADFTVRFVQFKMSHDQQKEFQQQQRLRQAGVGAQGPSQQLVGGEGGHARTALGRLRERDARTALRPSRAGPGVLESDNTAAAAPHEQDARNNFSIFADGGGNAITDGPVESQEQLTYSERSAKWETLGTTDTRRKENFTDPAKWSHVRVPQAADAPAVPRRTAGETAPLAFSVHVDADYGGEDVPRMAPRMALGGVGGGGSVVVDASADDFGIVVQDGPFVHVAPRPLPGKVVRVPEHKPGSQAGWREELIYTRDDELCFEEVRALHNNAKRRAAWDEAKRREQLAEQETQRRLAKAALPQPLEPSRGGAGRGGGGFSIFDDSAPSQGGMGAGAAPSAAAPPAGGFSIFADHGHGPAVGGSAVGGDASGVRPTHVARTFSIHSDAATPKAAGAGARTNGLAEQFVTPDNSFIDEPAGDEEFALFKGATGSTSGAGGGGGGHLFKQKRSSGMEPSEYSSESSPTINTARAKSDVMAMFGGADDSKASSTTSAASSSAVAVAASTVAAPAFSIFSDSVVAGGSTAAGGGRAFSDFHGGEGDAAGVDFINITHLSTIQEESFSAGERTNGMRSFLNDASPLMRSNVPSATGITTSSITSSGGAGTLKHKTPIISSSSVSKLVGTPSANSPFEPQQHAHLFDNHHHQQQQQLQQQQGRLRAALKPVKSSGASTPAKASDVVSIRKLEQAGPLHFAVMSRSERARAQPMQRVDPFEDPLHADELARASPPVHTDARYHDHADEACAWNYDDGKDDDVNLLELGERELCVAKILGEGGYGVVYEVQDFNDDDEEALYALKVEKEPSAWEFYMYMQVYDRVGANMRSRFGAVRAFYMYRNASFMLTDQYIRGSMQDVVNMYLSHKKTMPEALCVFYTIEMLRILETLCAAGIVHCDIKPDNLMLMCENVDRLGSWSVKAREQGWDDVGLVLIDFGRAVDTRLFAPNTEFIGDSEVSSFRCMEMADNKPWTYQADSFGLCSVVFTMLHGMYMDVTRDSATGRNKPLQMGSTFDAAHLWYKLFDHCLNIPDCDHNPSLSAIRREFEMYLHNRPATANSIKPLLCQQTVMFYDYEASQ